VCCLARAIFLFSFLFVSAGLRITTLYNVVIFKHFKNNIPKPKPTKNKKEKENRRQTGSVTAVTCSPLSSP